LSIKHVIAAEMLCFNTVCLQTVLKHGIRRRWQYQSANEMGC
jgi:hypothetical protein